MIRLVCLRVQNTNEGGETSSHHVVIEVVISRKKSPGGDAEAGLHFAYRPRPAMPGALHR
jgi:hypothetical protein